MPIRSYRDIEAYQRAKALIVPYASVCSEPAGPGGFDLCDQIRLWRIAMGSANEMIAHLEIAGDLGYTSRDSCRAYVEEYTIIAKQLNRLIQNWRTL